LYSYFRKGPARLAKLDVSLEAPFEKLRAKWVIHSASVSANSGL
jgi:hypothetical protein